MWCPGAVIRGNTSPLIGAECRTWTRAHVIVMDP
jgi:hypothetical protein